MPASRLVVEDLPIGSLVPSSNNARTHSKRQISQIAASIRRFGFNNPILADAENIVRAGHGRLEAAKQLGMATVPVIRASHMTPADFRAYALADNRLAEEAGWDEDILAIEFQELRLIAPDLDLTLTGFEVAEIDLIVEQAGQGQDPADEVEEVGAGLPSVCRPGDLWLLGDHRIFCGSALDPAAYRTLLDGNLADAVFTDPPYNVKISGHVSGKGAIQHREFAMASGEMSDGEFRDFLRSFTALLTAHSKPGSIHFVCMDWRHALPLLDVGTEFYDLKNICVWVKDNGGMGSLYRSQHELVMVFKKLGGEHQNNVQLGRFGRNRTNVWAYPGANSFSRAGEEGNLLALHPTVKPVQLVADALLDCTAPGNIVLDAFLGSGSTLIAAERTRRRCYGIELDPAYADTAIRRWQRHTGGHAFTPRPMPALTTSSRGIGAMSESDEDDKGAGYGRPPAKNRFKKGQSGNPKGRPKGAKNFATALSTELNGRIVISENGKRRKITRREVIAKQLVNRAVTGDPKSLPILFNETRALETAPPPVATATAVRQEDQAVMKGILDRLRAADEARKADAGSEPPPAEPTASADTDEHPTEITPGNENGDSDADA